MSAETAPPAPKIRRVLSGIRPSGDIHAGNYFGAMTNFVKYQRPENLSMYFMADLHALTGDPDPDTLRENVIKAAKNFLAAGLDPEQSILFAQSSVPETSELTVLLGNRQPLGELLRMTTFKEEVRKNPDNINHGVATYPVLMAADILGPQATLVPVGADQVPNVELARRLAERFNNKFGPTFAIPETMEVMIKVPGLDGEKMGKSAAVNAIDIRWSRAQILDRYLKAGITDVNKVRAKDPGDPYNGCKSVYPMHEIVTAGEKDTRHIAGMCQRGEIGCVACKGILADSIAAVLEPFQEKRAALENQDAYVRDVLHEGGKRAREIIKPTVEAVRDKMGVVVY